MYVYCPNEQRRLTLTSRAASTMPLFNSLPLSTAAPSMQMPQIAAATSWVRARWLRAPAIWSRPPQHCRGRAEQQAETLEKNMLPPAQLQIGRSQSGALAPVALAVLPLQASQLAAGHPR